MKGLTVRQPWASLIVNGVKVIETRTRPVWSVRGRIGIIAGLHEPADMSSVGDFTYWRRSPAGWIDRKGVHEVTGHEIEAHRGALIGTVELYDCVPIVGSKGCRDETKHLCVVNQNALLHSSLWSPFDSGETEILVSDQLPYGDFSTPGRWAWLLRDPQPLAEPIPMRGALGWQEVEIP